MQLSLQTPEHSIRYLVTSLLGWKLLLLCVAIISPGPGYDTSASLILPIRGKNLVSYVIEKLTRWDAIYFIKAANRGYLYEQEWAFGWGFTRMIALCTAALKKIGLPPFDGVEGLVAICIAHLAHLLSVLVLFQLTLSIFPRRGRTFAYIAASLHIISPAGLFLSAPYAESSCALLSFTGTLAFYRSFTSRGPIKNLYVLLSGLFFGIATTFRTNGILSGFLLLEEALRLLLSFRGGIDAAKLFRLISTGAAGIIVATGFVLPQYVAHLDYCGADGLARPWCDRTIPSVYIFVQEHYWNNGLFRYWTASNIPLFLLGAPMFAILFVSSFWVLVPDQSVMASPKRDTGGRAEVPAGPSKQIFYNLALQQLLLAFYTLTTAHVQIISRISSSYPVWLWYLGHLLRGKDTVFVGFLIQFMVIYSIIQAGLYASFLPPA